MTEIFRTPRSFRFLALGLTLFFLAGVIWSLTILFMDHPEKEGFADKRSAAKLAWFGVAVFGGMAVAGIYLLEMSYFETLSIDNYAIVKRSIFKNRQIPFSDVQTLKWKIAGVVVLRSLDQKIVVELSMYRREDRLKIIRRLRRLVSEISQVDWPMFCHKTALPLRDGISSMDRVMIKDSKISEDPYVQITRKRYDGQAAVVLPVSVVIAIYGYRSLHLTQFFALPGMVIFLWLLMRYSVPPIGQRQLRATGTKRNSVLLYFILWMFAAILLIPVLHYLGLSFNIAAWICVGIQLPILLIGIRGGLQADKKQKRDDMSGADSANECWERGEAAA